MSTAFAETFKDSQIQISDPYSNTFPEYEIKSRFVPPKANSPNVSVLSIIYIYMWECCELEVNFFSQSISKTEFQMSTKIL